MKFILMSTLLSLSSSLVLAQENNTVINYELDLLDMVSIENPKLQIKKEKKNFEKFLKKRARNEKWKKNAEERAENALGAFGSHDVLTGSIAQSCYSHSTSSVQWHKTAIEELDKKFGYDDIYVYLRQKNFMFDTATTLSTSSSPVELKVLSAKEEGNKGYIVNGDELPKRLVLLDGKKELKEVVIFDKSISYLSIPLNKEKCAQDKFPYSDKSVQEIKLTCARYAKLFK